jgi:hypothetical protein
MYLHLQSSLLPRFAARHRQMLQQLLILLSGALHIYRHQDGEDADATVCYIPMCVGR